MVPISYEENEYRSTDQRRIENMQKSSANQVREVSVGMLSPCLDLSLVGHRYTDEDLWNGAVAAAAGAECIESAATELDGAPHGSTVRHYLRTRLLEGSSAAELEEACNGILPAQVPRGVSKTGATRWPLCVTWAISEVVDRVE